MIVGGKVKELKKLSQIVRLNRNFDRAVEAYLDQLRKKRDWNNLEEKLNECKDQKWPEDKLKKIFQWERNACKAYNKSLDFAMEEIRHMADNLTLEQIEELAAWIKNSPHSKAAWDKNTLSVSDHISVIKAKIVHLAYISKSTIPINIGDMINSKE